MFKQPYLLGVTEGGIEEAPQLKKTDPEIQDMDNYDDGLFVTLYPKDNSHVSDALVHCKTQSFG